MNYLQGINSKIENNENFTQVEHIYIETNERMLDWPTWRKIPKKSDDVETCNNFTKIYVKENTASWRTVKWAKRIRRV